MKQSKVNVLKSPITGKENVVLFEELDSKKIIKLYKDELSLDVKNYFDGIPKVKVYKCQDSGFKFYFPFSLAGDEKFYEVLGKRKNYYRSWRQEHQYVFEKINHNSTVLELGCGPGVFLERLKSEKGCNCKGLEFNKEAVQLANSKGLEVFNLEIQDFAKEFNGKFDVVCSFQVMEHVVKIKEIIEASISLLRPGGKLIIAVPNNNPYIYKYEKYHTLNLPPHHIGLWDKYSLKKISDLFPLKLENIYTEPLEKPQAKLYHNAYLEMLKERFPYFRIFLAPVSYSYLFLIKLLTHFKTGLIDGRNLIAFYRVD